MAKPFAFRTGDPRFDPMKPVTVNGYLYEPAADEKRAATARMRRPIGDGFEMETQRG